MTITEFLAKNPLYDVYDLQIHKIDGEYDKSALKALHDSIRNKGLVVAQVA